MKSLKNRLHNAIDLAATAPSSHNSQPWEIVLFDSREALSSLECFGINLSSSALYIAVCLNKERQLRSLDCHHLEMALSIGIFLENLSLALHSQRCCATFCWANSQNVVIKGISSNWKPLAIIAVSDSDHDFDTAFLDKRITNRGPYQQQRISSDVQQQLINSNSLLFNDAKEHCRICFVEDSEKISRIANFVSTHAKLEFTHSKAWRETYKFVSFGAQKEIGLPITQLFGPLSTLKKYWYRVLFSPFVMSFLKHTKFPETIAAQFGQLVATTPALLYVNFHEENPDTLTLLKGGALLFQLWLNAAKEGISFHPMSIVLQHTDICKAFVKDHGLPRGRSMFFSRVGYPQFEFPPAPKRKNLSREIHTI
ncbi:hypothetical protein [Candidatus Uabimicrobium amorphum]|uniref:RedV protein n=1 Tax=Uabimicrobium amorphum TaxID=2596890 RepID=A0A5S9IJN2_UABAM|nr:hypothetical protein [Candidatus Uabimicrobium amorphum]BBM82280.1 RedV protein [Candidatus Uabimicrobium amorphum]